MSALRDDRSVPPGRVHRPAGARPSIDVPGLEQPAHLVTAALSEGEYGHRAVLVIASEDGSTVTTAQLGQLADELESLFGDEAPEGSRAWLRAKAAQWQEAAGRVNGGQVAALQELADLRHAIETGGPMPRGVIADTVHNLRGRAEVAERALMAARDELATARDERDRLIGRLDHTRGERDAQANRAEEAEAAYREARDAGGRTERALTNQREHVEALRAELLRAREARSLLAAQNTAICAALREEQDRVAHERAARQSFTEAWTADAEFAAGRYQAARGKALRNLIVGAATGALSVLTAIAAAWAARRRGDTP